MRKIPYLWEKFAQNFDWAYFHNTRQDIGWPLFSCQAAGKQKSEFSFQIKIPHLQSDKIYYQSPLNIFVDILSSLRIVFSDSFARFLENVGRSWGNGNKSIKFLNKEVPDRRRQLTEIKSMWKRLQEKMSEECDLIYDNLEVQCHDYGVILALPFSTRITI